MAPDEPQNDRQASKPKPGSPTKPTNVDGLDKTRSPDEPTPRPAHKPTSARDVENEGEAP